jgi:hypothetical protein
VIEIEIEGLAEALDNLAQGNQHIGRALKRAMTASTQLVRKRLAKYPGKSAGAQPFVSDKQRRFFFAALREGRIQVPYRRTGTLGRKWTSKVTVTDTDVAGFVGTTAPYAPFVQGFGAQARIHAGNWQTEQDVAADSRDEVLDIFAGEISRAMGAGD